MNRRSYISRSTIAVACLLPAFLAIGGCGTLNLDSASDARIDSLGTTSALLRFRLISAAFLLSTTIESAADSIIHLSNDTQVDKHAMMWKIYGIPRGRQALLYPDPLGGSFDGWAFAIQMRNFFETGEGENLFGPQQDIAIRASRHLSTSFYEGISSFADSSRTLEFRDRLEQWSAEHPVTSLHFNRMSIIPTLSSLVTPEEKTAITALGAIAQNLDDLTLRLNLYAAQTPTEARWQAEYMLLDVDAKGRLDSIETRTDRLLNSLELMTETLASGKFTMDILSLRSFHEDVQSLTSLVHAEHEAIFMDIDRQRLASLMLLDSLARRSVREAGSEAQTAVDHFVLRLAQLSAALVIAIALVIGGWYLGRRNSGRRA